MYVEFCCQNFLTVVGLVVQYCDPSMRLPLDIAFRLLPGLSCRIAK